MTVTDLRTAPQPFTLRDNGFQLERFEVPKDIDWENEQEVSLNVPVFGCFKRSLDYAGPQVQYTGCIALQTITAPTESVNDCQTAILCILSPFGFFAPGNVLMSTVRSV